MTKLPKRVHIVGICGVATSALAIAFHERGVDVTGSDKGFYPPVSTELEKHGVKFYAGWHPEKMIDGGAPETVIVGTASGSQNPETVYAKEHGIPIYSFAQAIGEFFARENSIVCVGTWGKTSSAALLSFIIDRTGWNPSYMFGGVSASHQSAKLTDGRWSVFEGDEYKSSPSDPNAKFFYYKPTHLLLTAVSWDHADLYPTEKDYFEAFNKLLASLPDKGFVVACADHVGVNNVIGRYKGKTVRYGKANKEIGSPDYSYDKVKQSRNGLDFTVYRGGNEWQIHSPMLGAFQAENITGCFAMAHSLGIAPERIVEAVARFKGLKRRLEKRLDGDEDGSGITVIDDIAHSPEKAKSVLTTLKSIYSGKIIAVFEPNTGGRRREAAGKYDDAFKNADVVVIPRLTKLKVAVDEPDRPLEGEELAQIIGKTHTHVNYIESDEKTVTFLRSQTTKGDVIVFLGSHGFRGMIEETIKVVS